MEQHFELYAIPSWALCYLINGDPTGLTEDDLLQANRWTARERIGFVCVPEEDSQHFNPKPAFGLACDCYDCYCQVLD